MLSTIAIVMLLVHNAHAMRTDYTAEALEDKITNLPGAPKDSTWTMFSGYITVDKANGRNLHYWFVESKTGAATKPVALWTNGGPGCSGLIGFFNEHGPLLMINKTNLRNNEYAWANVVNALYVEIPAGVGFSYSNVASDYITGDEKTAKDAYKMIQLFLEKFPNYLKNDFYITSESWGGHYMPTLARAIADGNKAGGNPQINFKGFLVGNPYTDPVENAKGQYDTWYGHQLLPLPLHKKWSTTCKDGAVQSRECNELEGEMSALVGRLDPYDLDYPVCTKNSREAWWFMKKVWVEGLGKFKEVVPPYDPCQSNYMNDYLNIPAVQEAIHVKKMTWSDCSGKVRWNQSDFSNPMEPIYKYLIDNFELKIAIMSGDDDSVCGTLGTQSWIWNLGYNVDPKLNWKVWYLDQQVSGYITRFMKPDNKTSAFGLITAHSAGHEIAMTRPIRGLAVLQKYLAGEIV